MFVRVQARQTASARRQQEGEALNSGSDRDATTELLRIKDHLIDIEKNVRFPQNKHLSISTH